MTVSRRQAVALAASSALAACARRKILTPTHAGPMDTKRLDREFPALADRARPGAFALGVMDLGTTETWYWNTDRAFPLASTVAMPIAVAALAKIETGRLALAQPVRFDALDLSPPPSLINQHWPTPPDNHTASIPVQSLLTLAVRQADNTAIDVLMKQVGGPGAVDGFLQLKGVTGLTVDRYMREIGVGIFGMPTFRAAWKDPAAFNAARDQVPPPARQAAMDAFILDSRDSSTVPAALGFLAMLADGELISPASAGRLLGWMGDASGSRFRAGLPGDVQLARIAGATATDLGFTAATTELAIATFPQGRRYALAAFLVGSTGTEAARAALFADAARLLVKAIA